MIGSFDGPLRRGVIRNSMSPSVALTGFLLESCEKLHENCCIFSYFIAARPLRNFCDAARTCVVRLQKEICTLKDSLQQLFKNTCARLLLQQHCMHTTTTTTSHSTPTCCTNYQLRSQHNTQVQLAYPIRPSSGRITYNPNAHTHNPTQTDCISLTHVHPFFVSRAQ